MRLVAAIQVDDHRRQAFERSRAGERAGVDGAPGDDPRRQLQRELLRRAVVAADERVLFRLFVAAAASCARPSSREPTMTSTPASARRRASAFPKLPVPPIIATLTSLALVWSWAPARGSGAGSAKG